MNKMVWLLLFPMTLVSASFAMESGMEDESTQPAIRSFQPSSPVKNKVVRQLYASPTSAISKRSTARRKHFEDKRHELLVKRESTRMTTFKAIFDSTREIVELKRELELAFSKDKENQINQFTEADYLAVRNNIDQDYRMFLRSRPSTPVVSPVKPGKETSTISPSKK
jgi:hypothetical protein